MFRTFCFALFAVTVLFAGGCGPSEPTGPKEELNDKEKQQVKDLNEQRKEEWKNTKTKQ